MLVIKDIINKEDISREKNEGPQGNAIKTSVLENQNKQFELYNKLKVEPWETQKAKQLI